MQQLMNEIEALVSQYEDRLLAKGIICTVSKKYFETNTMPRPLLFNGLFEILFDKLSKRRENKKYKHQRNRTHCAVLCFSPVDTGLVKKADCKEYSFVLFEVFRAMEGTAPKRRIKKEKRVLKKVEKTILHILNAAEKKSVEKVCKNSNADILRYSFNNGYGYKKSICGIDRDVLDTVFSVSVIVAVLIIALIIYCVIK